MSTNKAEIIGGRLSAHAEAGEHVIVSISKAPSMVLDNVRNEFSGCIRTAKVSIVCVGGEYSDSQKATATDSIIDEVKAGSETYKATPMDSELHVGVESQTDKATVMDRVAGFYKTESTAYKEAVEAYEKRTEEFIKELQDGKDSDVYLKAAEAYKKKTEDFIKDLKDKEAELNSQKAAVEAQACVMC